MSVVWGRWGGLLGRNLYVRYFRAPRIHFFIVEGSYCIHRGWKYVVANEPLPAQAFNRLCFFLHKLNVWLPGTLEAVLLDHVALEDEALSAGFLPKKLFGPRTTPNIVHTHDPASLSPRFRLGRRSAYTPTAPTNIAPASDAYIASK